ncbi:MAG: 16S rRNA (cytidine(1402)-2'-O)-methyltransferase [Bdellovibrionales bacterium]|nr:16S rRNA (cytidine(1402)-2'-O)-methyltransferase [Bdellovibrionales bacterium]
MTQKIPPTLYVIATPIGNLSDSSFRMLEVLKNIEHIFCEDTRHSQKLLSHFDLKGKTLYRCDQIQEKQISSKAIDLLSQGQDIAYLSDAGTPSVSDPGTYLVNACHLQGFQVLGVPGPSAVSLALSIAGFWAVPFTFHGFLDRKKTKSVKQIIQILQQDHTQVLFESPYRIVSTVEMIAKHAPSRELFIARELTKKFEQSYRGNAQNVLDMVSSKAPKGEYTLVISEIQERKNL